MAHYLRTWLASGGTQQTGGFLITGLPPIQPGRQPGSQVASQAAKAYRRWAAEDPPHHNNIEEINRPYPCNLSFHNHIPLASLDGHASFGEQPTAGQIEQERLRHRKGW